MLQVNRDFGGEAMPDTLVMTDITDKARTFRDYDNHQRVLLGRDETRGLTAIIAIHNTTLGPALGGTRVWPHENLDAALTDALRLSRGMTFKAAISGVPFGGGKAVIIADPKTDKTPALLEAYADMLRQLAGDYYTGEDVGLTLSNADFLRALTPNVTGTTIGGSGNPSPVTAEGVFRGLKAAVKYKTGSDDLNGLPVAVQGLGSVGWSLCEKLVGQGARLVVTDIDDTRMDEASMALGAELCLPADIVSAEADVFAPCALGGVLSEETIPTLKAGIVAGAANNQLAVHDDAMRLKERGVLYAPDYVINAGGLINVAAELAPGGYDRSAVMEKLADIAPTLEGIFARSDETGRATNDVAQEIAEERIAAAA